ncbi:MAG: hypothetical protein V1799_12870 [bacterium]
MINRYRILVLVFLSLTIIASCKITTNPLTPDVPTIYGTWNWESSIGGFAGHILTPKSTGYMKQVRLYTSGVYEEYRNNEQVLTSPFIIKDKVVGQQTYQLLLLSNFPGTEFYIKLQGRDTLLLSDPFVDGYQHTYRRQR